MNQALNRLLQENKTAFYVFDIGKLKARIAHLQAVFSFPYLFHCFPPRFFCVYVWLMAVCVFGMPST